MDYDYPTPASPSWFLLADAVEPSQDFCYGAKASSSASSSPQAYVLTPPPATPSTSSSPLYPLQDYLDQEWMESRDNLADCLPFSDDRWSFDTDQLAFADVTSSPTNFTTTTETRSCSNVANKIVIKLKKVRREKGKSTNRKNDSHLLNTTPSLFEVGWCRGSPNDALPTDLDDLSPTYPEALDLASLPHVDALLQQTAGVAEGDEDSWLETERTMDDLLLFQDQLGTTAGSSSPPKCWPVTFPDSPPDSELMDDDALDQSLTLRDVLSSGDEQLVDQLLFSNDQINESGADEEISISVDDFDTDQFMETIEFVSGPIVDASPSSSLGVEPVRTKASNKKRSNKRSVRPKLTSDMRHSRKKLQNREAAVRYRNKRKLEDQDLSVLVDEASLEQDRLRERFAKLQQEVKFMKNLLREAFPQKSHD